MNYEELSEFAMQIIANSGMSRSASMEAVKFAREGEFDIPELAIICIANSLNSS